MTVHTADGAQSRRAQQRATSVARITSAAETLLSETERYSELSVEQIISSAGVSRSTFYSYFDDMGHLLRTVGQGVLEDVIRAARRWMDLDVRFSERQLRAIFTHLVATYRARANLLAALAEASVYDPGVRDEFHRLFAVGLTELAKHIRRAQTAGFARAEIDPESTAAWLVWMIERGLYQQIRLATEDELDRQVRSLTSIVWHALYTRPRVAQR